MFPQNSDNVWHVRDVGGDNGNSGHSWTNARKTFLSAHDSATAGDIIIVWGGTYSEKMDITKNLTVIGMGIGVTIFSVTSGSAAAVASSGVTQCLVKKMSLISSASGQYGFFCGNSGSIMKDMQLEDLRCEGDLDGLHMASAHNIAARRVYAKGKFDGLQLGSGNGRFVEDCTGETDGTNTVTADVNGIVCASASNVIIRNCKGIAKRTLNGDVEDLIGINLRGENIIGENLTVDVDHTGTGSHTTIGLKLGGGVKERITVNGITGRVEATEGTVIGIQVAFGSVLVTGINLEAEVEINGTAIGIDVGTDDVGLFLNGQIREMGGISAWDGSCTEQGGGGLEKKQFIDSSAGAIGNGVVNGWDLVWTSGNNFKEQQIILDFTQPGNKFDFTNDFTNDIEVGDTYDLYQNGAPILISLRNTGTMIVGSLDYRNDYISGTIKHLSSLVDTSGRVDISKIDGNKTDGNNATLNLKKLDIQNSSGDAIVAKSTGGNGKGIDIAGNGTGDAILITAGITGNGIAVLGGATSGAGIKITVTDGDSFDFKGFTAGGTTTFETLLKFLASSIGGKVQDKSGSPGILEYLDFDNSTVIYELDWETETPYRTVTII